ncbi:hypothetical protein P8452_53219 [Trifolium repens]|nr:hypothetical protein P8452_53219 [Trifolium repens]
MEYYDCEQEQWLPGVPPKAFLTTQQHISNASGSGDTPMINVSTGVTCEESSQALPATIGATSSEPSQTLPAPIG